jgi:hypothetical protein
VTAAPFPKCADLRLSGQFRSRLASALILRTLFIERIKHYSEGFTFGTVRVDLLKPIHQFHVFGTKLLSFFVELFAELVNFLCVFLFICGRDLVIELRHVAIQSDFCFVTADNFDNFFSVCLGWLRSPRGPIRPFVLEQMRAS